MDGPGLRGTAVGLEEGHAEARCPQGKDRRIPQIDPDREPHSALSAPPRTETPQVQPRSDFSRSRWTWANSGSVVAPKPRQWGRGRRGSRWAKDRAPDVRFPSAGWRIRVRPTLAAKESIRVTACRRDGDARDAIPPPRWGVRAGSGGPSRTEGSPRSVGPDPRGHCRG